MSYRKHANDLRVNWALLGELGWWIDEWGAEAADLDPTGTMGCHLDRTTLDVLICGPAEWVTRRLRELADAGVPGLEWDRTWQLTTTNDTVAFVFKPILTSRQRSG